MVAISSFLSRPGLSLPPLLQNISACITSRLSVQKTCLKAVIFFFFCKMTCFDVRVCTISYAEFKENSLAPPLLPNPSAWGHYCLLLLLAFLMRRSSCIFSSSFFSSAYILCPDPILHERGHCLPSFFSFLVTRDVASPAP